MPARLPPNRTVNSRAVLAKMERWSRAALARLAKQAEHTDRSGATQTVFHSTASSLPIPFVICRLLLTASSGAKYDEKSGLGVAGGRSAVQRFQRIRRKETKMAQTKGLVLPFVALFSVCAFPLLSFGAVGDVVGSVTFSHNCPSGPNGGLGVGLAFDGSNLWYSCYAASPDLLRANPLTGVVTASYNIAGGLGALAYDSTRDVD